MSRTFLLILSLLVWTSAADAASQAQVASNVQIHQRAGDLDDADDGAMTASARISDAGPGREDAGKELVVPLPGGAEMEFVWIEPGTFLMGTSEKEKQRLEKMGWWHDWMEDELPQHKVEITRGFWLGKYEITQAQWESVMESKPSDFKGADRPVEQVSWYDVQDFIHRLNEAAGDSLYRLPTEAEWEYACRAGTTTRWSFGDDESQLRKYAWYYSNSGGHTHSVGQKAPNPWGLYDMYGNVWEWCQDWYSSSYYKDSPRRDPSGSSEGSARVLRGGGFYYGAPNVRSADRGGSSPSGRSNCFGARLLRMR